MDVGRGSLALAMHGARGLALALHEGRLTARPISSDGRALGSQRSARVPGAEALLALEPQGARYLMIARGSCEASARCLIAQALDRRGGPLGAASSVPLPGPIRTSRRASEGGPLFFAWSTISGHRALERFAIEAGGSVAHARVALGAEPASAEHPVEILGLAADGPRASVVWRRGPAEDTESEVYVTSAGAGGEASHVEAHALHHALAIDSIARSGDELALIATFEFSRPHALRVRLADGQARAARELAPGARAPAPFTDRRRAELEVDAGGLWLRRRDAAGDPLGERVLVTRSRVSSAALARSGDALLVAWIAGGALHGRRVTAP